MPEVARAAHGSAPSAAALADAKAAEQPLEGPLDQTLGPQATAGRCADPRRQGVPWPTAIRWPAGCAGRRSSKAHELIAGAAAQCGRRRSQHCPGRLHRRRPGQRRRLPFPQQLGAEVGQERLRQHLLCLREGLRQRRPLAGIGAAEFRSARGAIRGRGTARGRVGPLPVPRAGHGRVGKGPVEPGQAALLRCGERGLRGVGHARSASRAAIVSACWPPRPPTSARSAWRSTESGWRRNSTCTAAVSRRRAPWSWAATTSRPAGTASASPVWEKNPASTGFNFGIDAIDLLGDLSSK